MEIVIVFVVLFQPVTGIICQFLVGLAPDFAMIITKTLLPEIPDHDPTIVPGSRVMSTSDVLKTMSVTAARVSSVVTVEFTVMGPLVPEPAFCAQTLTERQSNKQDT